MTGEPVGQSVADVLGLLRAVRNGETEMLTQAVCQLTLDELWQGFIVALALLSTLADAMDEQRAAAGLEPMADSYLEGLVRNLKTE
ncbi:MAG TPA: hypothetical protein VF162_17745 [Streptosporangiaceae bacterium]